MSNTAFMRLDASQEATPTQYAEVTIPVARRLQLTALADKAREPVGKRAFDVLSASALLLFAAPLMLVIFLLVHMDGGQAIFAHRRIGRGGREFACLKFRTMCVDAGPRLEHLLNTDREARIEWARDHKLRNDPRVTPLGRFLRASSLDELPQLLNIICGDMSVVGPRPIVQAEVVKYGRRIKPYLQTRPGLTGIWQVSGRNDLSYRRRVAMDTIYAKKQGFLLDTRIILLTIPAVLLSKGSC